MVTTWLFAVAAIVETFSLTRWGHNVYISIVSDFSTQYHLRGFECYGSPTSTIILLNYSGTCPFNDVVSPSSTIWPLVVPFNHPLQHICPPRWPLVVPFNHPLQHICPPRWPLVFPFHHPLQHICPPRWPLVFPFHHPLQHYMPSKMAPRVSLQPSPPALYALQDGPSCFPSTIPSSIICPPRWPLMFPFNHPLQHYMPSKMAPRVSLPPSPPAYMPSKMAPRVSLQPSPPA